MNDSLSLLIDHGDHDYDYYECLAVAVERLAVVIRFLLLIRLRSDSACRFSTFSHRYYHCSFALRRSSSFIVIMMFHVGNEHSSS